MLSSSPSSESSSSSQHSSPSLSSSPSSIRKKSNDPSRSEFDSLFMSMTMGSVNYSLLRMIYSQLGLLMTALINDPQNVNYVHTISARVYQSMVLYIGHSSELGCPVHWVQNRVSYIRDIMNAADDYLQRKLPYDTYLRDSRIHMDLCSRGGIIPSKPPGC